MKVRVYLRSQCREKRLLALSCLSISPSVRPSVRPSSWNSSAHTGRIFMKFGILNVSKIRREKFKFH